MLGEAHRQATTIVGIGSSLDQPNPHQRVDRSAYRRSTAADGLGDLVEGRRLIAFDGRQQHPLRAVGALGGTVREKVLRNRDIARGNSRR